MPVKVARPLKIMLIDDNLIDLKINSKIISLSGLFDEIIVCRSGDEAISYFLNNSAAPEHLPHLILLDIQMPEMDGFEFLNLYKQFPEALKSKSTIAMLSSTLDFGDTRKAEANPYVSHLLKKPLLTANLQRIFNEHFVLSK